MTAPLSLRFLEENAYYSLNDEKYAFSILKYQKNFNNDKFVQI